jgi:mannose-6-phosphate isomerase
VQVHPDDDYARRNETAAGGTGKTELWYAVSARAGAELLLGLEAGVTAESFRRAIEDGTVERCFRRFPVHAGDGFFVPAGTAHTIGPGMVLCEVQQHSDITYRVFDYNRVQSDGTARALHVRQALEVMNFGEQRGGRIESIEARRGALAERYYAACRYFAVERWEFTQRVERTTSAERFELLVVLAGRGRFEWGGEATAYGPGEAWFLPAALGAYRLAPESATMLLRTYVPELGEFTRELADRQIDKALWPRVVHP